MNQRQHSRWYALERAGGAEELRLEHVRQGQELRYEQGGDNSEWRITKVAKGGRFQAVHIPQEEGEHTGAYIFRLLIQK